MIVRTVLTWVMPSFPRKVQLRITITAPWTFLKTINSKMTEKVNFGWKWQNIIQLLRAIKYQHIVYYLGCEHKHFTVGMFLIYICPTWHREATTYIDLVIVFVQQVWTNRGRVPIPIFLSMSGISLPSRSGLLLYSPAQWEKEQRNVAGLGLRTEPDTARGYSSKTWRKEAFPDPTV